MVEPARQDDLVHSGFALHAGRLIAQYAGLTRGMPPAERYEATLTLSTLQFLLTNCWELYLFLDKKHTGVLGSIDDYVVRLLTEPDVEVRSEFPDEKENRVTGRALVQHLRHALSHQRMQVQERLPTTGYTTIEDGSGLVSRLRFTHSPDVTTRGDRRPSRGRYVAPHEPKVFEIELPLSRLTALTMHTALVLGQPALDNWDSKDLVRPPEFAWDGWESRAD